MAVLLVWFVTVLLFVCSVSQDIPTVAVDDSNCPVGSGVNKKTILIDTPATCRCVVTKQGNPPAQARWYTINNQTVGTLDNNDNSSVLTVSYNPSDPNPTYQCRPFTTQNTTINAVTYTPQFRCSYKYVEIGSSYNITLSVPPGVSSIVWQLIRNGSASNLTTCSLVNNTCTVRNSNSIYTNVNGTTRETSLFVNNVSNLFQQFAFMADNGVRSCLNELEVYKWPTVANCTYIYTLNYLEITCVSDDVSPGLTCKLSRLEKPLEDADFEIPYAQSTLGERKYDVPIRYLCTWRLKMESMLPNSHFIGELSALVSNYSKIDNTPIIGSTITNFTFPVVKLDVNECPLGETHIKSGTTAYCRCVITEPLTAPGQARWYTDTNVVTGKENTTEKSSTLELTYDSSDKSPKYYCKPFTHFPGTTAQVPYEPKFNSSPRISAITGLLALIIIVGAVLSGGFSL